MDLSIGKKIEYSISPLISYPGTVIFKVSQAGSIDDSNFTNSLASDISTACADSAGNYTWNGEYVTAKAGTATAIKITRTVAVAPAEGDTYSLSAEIISGAILPNPTRAVIAGNPTIPNLPEIKGANLSGMEFSGKVNTAPFFPTFANVDIYATRGFNVIRLPCRWSRIQNELYGDLHINGDGTGDAERYKALVDYITDDKDMYVIVEPHDFGGRLGYSQKIGSAELPVLAFQDFWIKFITYLGISNQKIIINLENEPVGINPVTWAKISASVTSAIRSTGSLQHIQVPGIGYTQAATWVSSGNADAMLNNFEDPAENYSYEVHQYLDGDSSGTHPVCVIGSENRLDAFISWLETNNLKGFLGEVAGAIPADPQCSTELNGILDACDASPAMYGWSAWGGGQYWNTTYMFRIENPVTGGPDTPIMDLLVSKL